MASIRRTGSRCGNILGNNQMLWIQFAGHPSYHNAGRAGKSFVYSAPTSGGKSLVADILMLNALQRSITSWHKPCKKALVLVPYLSIGKTANCVSLISFWDSASR